MEGTRAGYDDFDGELLRRARSGRGLSREELADAAGLAARELARYEAGRERPSPDAIRALASALRVSPYTFTDPDVIVSVDEVAVNRRPGETQEQWHERFQSARPPFSPDASRAIRAAGGEYRRIIRAERKRPDEDEE